MPYTAEISRTNPGCILILLDQSYSMSDRFSDESQQKSEVLTQTINRILQELVIKCSKDMDVYRYFSVGVIGYGAKVGPAFGGTLAGQPLVWIDDIYRNPMRVEDRMKKVPDGAGGIIETSVKFPVWFDPITDNGTPMKQAFQFALPLLQNWVIDHPDSFPPILINVTDGESTDGDPSQVARQISSLETQDGATLVMNLHLSSSKVAPIQFPFSDTNLPDQYAQMLFGISSKLPSVMRESATQMGYKLVDDSRAFVFNAGIEDAIQFLIIGTQARNR